jgi:hypothetical protein
MRLRQLVRYPTKLTCRQQALLLQALLALLYSALLLRLFHFEHLQRRLRLRPFAAPMAMGGRHEPLAAQLGWAIDAIANRVPGTVKCLTRSLAASLLAHRHGLDVTLCLGVMRSPSGELQAHAWSRCGACIITGKAQQPQFAAIACFSFDESLPAA